MFTFTKKKNSQAYLIWAPKLDVLKLVYCCPNGPKIPPERGGEKHQNYVNDFCEKKFLFLTIGPFSAQKYQSIITGSAIKKFKYLHNERGQEIHEHYFNSFSEKIFGENGPFGTQKWCMVITLDLL